MSMSVGTESTDSLERYIAAAVRSILEELENTPTLRNAALNKAAFALGQFVGAGALGQHAAEVMLKEACEKNGYARKDGRASMEGTIRSGLRQGIQKPRELSSHTALFSRPANGNGHHIDNKVEEQPTGCSLEEFSAARHTPVAVLQHFHVRDGHFRDRKYDCQGVEFQHPLRDGSFGQSKWRLGMAGIRFRPHYTDKRPAAAYEPDAGQHARQEGYVVICEGESDPLLLLWQGFPALGIPGVDRVALLEATSLEGLTRIYVVCEGDAAGKSFGPKIRRRLKEVGFDGEVFDVAMTKEAKDPCELYGRNPDGFKQAFNQLLQDASDPPCPPFLTFQEFFIHSVKPVPWRLRTGLPTLDESLRGGIPPEQLIVIAGAPGAMKTSLAAYWGDLWERQGYAVVFYAGDEAGGKIAIRFAQMSGASRDGLESLGHDGDAHRGWFARECAPGRNLILLDPRITRKVQTIDDAELVLRKVSRERPGILVLDSLQSLRAKASEGCDSEYERTTLNIDLCRQIAYRGYIVVAISEMSRSGYRSGDPNMDSSGLASAKGSGRIEYNADLLIALRSVKGESSQIQAEVSKSRIGGDKADLRLSFDRQSATFSEMASPEALEAARGQAEMRLERARERIRDCLKTQHDLGSQREVLAHTNGTKQHNADAFKDMVKLGEIVVVSGTMRLVERPKTGSAT